MARGRAELNALLREALAAIELGNSGGALMLLHRAEALAPSPAEWRAIGDAWHAAENSMAGGIAHQRAARASARDRELVAAREALDREALPVAEATLRTRLNAHPTDIAAMRMLAELQVRTERIAEAEETLERALALAPDFRPVQDDLAALRPTAL